MQKMDHFIPPPDHPHLLSFPLILPRLDTCQHRFSSEGRLMGSERGRSPRPSGAGSRSIPAAQGSITDRAALPSARLDGRADHQDRLCSPRRAHGTAPLLLPTPPCQHLHSWAFPAWRQEPWWDLRSRLLRRQSIFCLLQPRLSKPPHGDHKVGLARWECFAGAQPLLTHPGHHGLPLAGKAPVPPPCHV